MKKNNTYYKKRQDIKRRTGAIGTIQALGMILYFPLMFTYLELLFHWYMKLDMRYAPIYIGFGISLGLLLSLFTINFGPKANRFVAYSIAFLGSLIYSIEIVCKAVLQQYYQLFSSADTAANNQLSDYMDAIVDGIVTNIFGLLLMFLPFIVLLVLGVTFYRFRRKYVTLSGLVLGGAVVFHLIAFGFLHLPWTGDFTPKGLYAMDTNIEDQVEQLGIATMLRLDVKHSLFGVNQTLENDFDGMKIPVVDGEKETVQPSTTPTQGESSATPEATPTVDTSPNVMEIDFDKQIKNAKNDDVKWLNEYFKSMTPTNKNQYTGMLEGYNVIFITAEGFSKYLIDKERTPTLYKLANEGFVFDNYYTPLHFTSTSGGEFQNMVGLYPKGAMPVSMKETGIKGTNLYFSLANQLNRLGYDSMGFHNNGEMYGRRKSHSNLGYNWMQGGEGYTMDKDSKGNNVWPQSDVSLMEQSVDQYINKDHFNVYYITVSGHMPYNFSSHAMSIKNESAVKNLSFSDTTKAYLAANMELEKGLTYLLQRLEEAGKLDKTLIVLSPDHIPYSNVAVLEELAGKKFGGAKLEYLSEADLDFDVYRNTLIMWSGSMKEPVKVDKICGQIDILPTVSNLLGLEYDSRLLMGSDILSESSPIVIFSSSSWLTDQGLYNRYSGKFTLADGITMSKEEQKEYVSVVKKIVSYKLQASNLIVEQDYYNTLFKKSQ